MCHTRAQFKQALRHCKAAEEQPRADARASQLANTDNPKDFWKAINRDNASNVSVYANRVGNAVSADDVCTMWKDQFNNLYNTLHDDGTSRQEFNDKADACVNYQSRTITVEDVASAVSISRRKTKVQA